MNYFVKFDKLVLKMYLFLDPAPKFFLERKQVKANVL